MRHSTPLTVLIINDLGVVNGVTRYIRDLTRYLIKTNNHVCLLEGFVGSDEHSKQKGIRRYIYSIHLNGIEDFWKITLSTWEKLRHIPLDTVDIIHCHHTASAFGVLLSGKAKKIPMIFHFHGALYREVESSVFPIPNYSFLRKQAESIKYRCIIGVLKRLQALCIKHSAVVIVPSLYAKQLAINSFHADPHKIEFIPNNVDTVLFKPLRNRTKNNISLSLRSHNSLLVVSRLDYRKGISNVIKAMETLLRVYPQTTLNIVFPQYQLHTPEYGKYDHQIKSMALSGSVRLVANTRNSDLVRFYNAAHCCIMPSITLENNPLVVLESLACGTPVLGTPIGGIPEILTQIDTCLLFDDTSPGAISRGIINYLRKSPGQIRSIKQKCRLLVQHKYAWENNIDKVLSLYAQITD